MFCQCQSIYICSFRQLSVSMDLMCECGHPPDSHRDWIFQKPKRCKHMDLKQQSPQRKYVWIACPCKQFKEAEVIHT